MVVAALFIARALGLAAAAVALAVKYLLTHPRSIPPFAVGALVAWLGWPYLGQVRGGWLVFAAAAGAAAAVPVFYVAVRDQHRFGADMRAPYTPGPAAPTAPGPRHWSEEYR